MSQHIDAIPHTATHSKMVGHSMVHGINHGPVDGALHRFMVGTGSMVSYMALQEFRQGVSRGS